MLRLFLFFLMIANLHSLSAQKITTDVQDRFLKNDKVDCIIVLQNQLDLYGKTDGMTKNEKATFVYNQLKNHSNFSQQAIRKYMSAEGIDYKSFFIFNGLQAFLTQVQAEYITTHFDIKHIVYNEDGEVTPVTRSIENNSRVDAEWGIVQIKADSVWQLGYEGSNVVIGGQDTGYDWDNSLLISKYRGYNNGDIDHSYNWHDAIDSLNPLHNDTIYDPTVNPCGLLSLEPCDDNGHGTHTMGTMVGRDSSNYIGVAPKASWIGCRNMDRGWGKASTYTDCFEWFLAPTDLEGLNPDPTKAPHVINNSWGCPTVEGCNISNWGFIEIAVNNLTAAGTVVVVSAGNSGNQGCNSVTDPAAIFEQSFSVGATNKKDKKAGFSSIGPVTVDSSYRIKPDIVAPGVNVRSTVLNEEFRNLNGTSMAGPHVAGVVALLIDANPALAGQVDEIKNIIKSTAVALTDTTTCDEFNTMEIPNFYFGYGRIDALAAVKIAMEYTSTVEVTPKRVAIFPNPNNGSFVLETKTKIDKNDIAILNSTGSRVYPTVEQSTDQRIHITDLAQGVYFIRIGHGKELITKKVVVVK